jgi:hypothetical protein
MNDGDIRISASHLNSSLGHTNGARRMQKNLTYITQNLGISSSPSDGVPIQKIEDIETEDPNKIYYFKMLPSLSKIQLLKKAARHFMDARYIRQVIHSIDYFQNTSFEKVYKFQTNPNWETVMSTLIWVYII